MHSGINDDNIISDFDYSHIFTDFFDSAEGHDADYALFRRRNFKSFIGMTNRVSCGFRFYISSYLWPAVSASWWTRISSNHFFEIFSKSFPFPHTIYGFPGNGRTEELNYLNSNLLNF